MSRRWRILMAVLVLLVAAGCSSSPGSPATVRYSRASDAAPLKATAPYVVMTTATAGWAVWPTGDVWVLLHTVDAFRHVSNRTPVAVPTDGGLVGSFVGDFAGVAVEASERLLRSPLLINTSRHASTSGTISWSPQQLPQPVVDARHALSLTPGPLTAVTSAAGGTVFVARNGVWSRNTDSKSLSASGAVQLDSIVWADPSVGWLTGHGSSGGPSAFVTRDGGATWTPVHLARPASVATLAPCGSGRRWLLPVIDSRGTMTIFRTGDQGQTWMAGAALKLPAGLPAWGCTADLVWAAGTADGTDHLFASDDGGDTWADRGAVPGGLTDLSPTGDGDGVAVTGGRAARIWSVTDDGAHFVAIVLPAWVAALGRQMSGS